MQTRAMKRSQELFSAIQYPGELMHVAVPAYFEELERIAGRAVAQGMLFVTSVRLAFVAAGEPSTTSIRYDEVAGVSGTEVSVLPELYVDVRGGERAMFSTRKKWHRELVNALTSAMEHPQSP
jgi:hypothetical protein